MFNLSLILVRIVGGQENARLEYLSALPPNPVFPPSAAVCLLGIFECLGDPAMDEEQECGEFLQQVE